MSRSLRSRLFLTAVALWLPVVSLVPLLPVLSPAPLLAQTSSDRSQEALKLLETGVKQSGAGQFTEAEQSFQKALAIYRELNDRSGQWFALYFTGTMYISLRNFVKGDDYLQQSLKLAQEMGDLIKQSDALQDLGRSAANQAVWAKAVEYYQQSLKLARETGDRTRESAILERLSLAYLGTGDSAKAREAQQQREALAGNAADPQARILEIFQRTQVLFDQGTTASLQEAMKQYETALTLSRQINNRDTETLALFGLGSTYSQLGQLQQGNEFLKQALQLTRSGKTTSTMFESATLLALGRNFANLGDRQSALDYYNQALKLLRAQGDRSGESTLLNNIGRVYADLGDYRQALDYTNQAVSLAQAVGDRSKVGRSLNNIGYIYSSLGSYQKALDYFAQSLPLFKELKEPFNEATTLNNIGTVYTFLGQRPKALTYFNQALNLLKEVGDRSEQAATLSNIGLIYSDEDSRKGIEYYNQALALVRAVGKPQSEVTILGNIGLEYGTLGDYPQAQRYFNDALQVARKLGDRTQEAYASGYLGQVAYAQKNYPGALQQLQQGLSVIRQVGDRRFEGFMQIQIGKVLLASNQAAAAEKAFLDGIRVWESIRVDVGSNDLNKISIFDEQARVYRLLQRALVAQNKPEAALEAAERGRARAFVELLARRAQIPTPQSSITPPTIQQIRQIAKTQNATLVQYSIIQDDLAPFPPSTPRETGLLIWVVKPTGEVILRQTELGNLRQATQLSLEDLLFRVRRSIGVRGIGVVATAPPEQADPVDRTDNVQLQQLHRLLIQPIADLLPTDPNARVIFMPQAALFYVPFAALQDSSGKYLVEKHTILTAPSIQVLDLTQQQRNRQRNRPASSSALVVGNPTMPKVPLIAGNPPEQLESLPGSEQEARTIAPLLKTEALIGDRATKITVMQQMPAARLVHLATHGLIDDLKGMGVPGAIALAPSGGDNGLLTADEILNLNLNAELVVLSACNTGRGRVTGDGVIGLSRSFITAGVPSLVVSLWAVPDAPTASLMTEFYQNLQKSPNKAQALRQAMLTTMGQYPNPRDWAAFTLIGEAE
jgi:CHAT domain-containing protein/Tfp pilus assembly protein PilF